MSNTSIREYLDFYIKHNGRLEYAVLLDGEWGSGKTYFIKNYIKNNDPKKFLYVSLYGLKQVTEIEDRFLQLSFPALHTPAIKVISKAIQSIELKGVSINASNVDLRDFLKRNKNSVIVFDDLERCDISINTTLGYINHLVEHQGSKVIILAHEEKIIPTKEDTGEFSKYLEIKEKLIGRTFTITAELEPALKEFVKSVSNEELRKFMESNLNEIVQIYNVISYQNLRSLKQAIDEFCRFFEILPAKAKTNNQLLMECLNTLMILLFELRKGLIATDEIQNVSSTSIYYLGQIDKKKEEELSNREKFFKKYGSKNFYEICPNDFCWYDFFKFGTISSEKLNESIQNSKYFREENVKEWVKLYYFSDIDEEEFNNILTDVQTKFKNKEYRKPGIIKHVLGLFIHFSKEGLIETKMEDLLIEFKKVLSELSDENLITPEERVNDRDYAYAGLGYFSFETTEFKEVSNILDGFVIKTKEKSFPDIAQQALELVKTPQKFRDALSHNSAKSLKFNNVPIFKYIDPDKFIEEYLTSPSSERDFISYAIKDRYDLVFHYPYLNEEFECISLIDSKLQQLEMKTTRFNKYKIKSFREHTLKPALNKLIESKKRLDEKV